MSLRDIKKSRRKIYNSMILIVLILIIISAIVIHFNG